MFVTAFCEVLEAHFECVELGYKLLEIIE